jgi:tetratricopeptide (TPR) repeat protein
MDRSHVSRLLNQGIAAAKAKQRRRAKEYLLKVIELDEGNEQAWLWLSGVMDALEDQKICLENVLSINPQNAHARAGLQWLEKLMAASAEPSPGSSTPCPFCGGQNSGTTATCRHCGQSLLVDCPGCDEYVDVEERECPHCGTVLGDAHDEISYWARLATAYLSKGKPRSALEAWQRVFDLDSSYPNIQVHLADAYRAVGDISEAIEAYGRAIEASPENDQPRLKLARLYREIGSLAKATVEYNVVLSLSPHSAALHYELGTLYHEGKDYKRAFQAYKRAIECDSAHAKAHFQLGRLYEIVGREGQAVKAYTRALALSPPQAEKIHKRLHKLRPPIPVELANGWPETFRQMARIVVAYILIALLQAGLKPLQIPAPSWFALLMAVLGSYLLVCALSTPRNPTLQSLLGEKGIDSLGLRWAVGLSSSLVLLVCLATIYL